MTVDEALAVFKQDAYTWHELRDAGKVLAVEVERLHEENAKLRSGHTVVLDVSAADDCERIRAVNARLVEALEVCGGFIEAYGQLESVEILHAALAEAKEAAK